MQYIGACGPVKFRIFPLTLEGPTLEWFTELVPNTISSWDQLARVFSARFTASRVKPKSHAVLKAIRQEENETLHEYVKRFNKEAANVRGLEDHIRPWFLRDGLRTDNLFEIEVGIKEPPDLVTFLCRSQWFINYEESVMSRRAVARGATEWPQEDREQQWRRDRDQGGSSRDLKSRKFIDRTKLNTSYAQTLSECANTEFRDVKRPDPLILKEVERPSHKYCRYHQRNGHETNNCMALEDDIKELIRKGS